MMILVVDNKMREYNNREKGTNREKKQRNLRMIKKAKTGTRWKTGTDLLPETFISHANANSYPWPEQITSLRPAPETNC